MKKIFDNEKATIINEIGCVRVCHSPAGVTVKKDKPVNKTGTANVGAIFKAQKAQSF